MSLSGMRDILDSFRGHRPRGPAADQDRTVGEFFMTRHDFKQRARAASTGPRGPGVLTSTNRVQRDDRTEMGESFRFSSARGRASGFLPRRPMARWGGAISRMRMPRRSWPG